MRSVRATTGAVVVIASLLAQPLFAVTVTVDRGTRYQTIEGFGAAGTSLRPWQMREGPFWLDVDLDSVGFYDTVISELGATMFRIMTDRELETVPGTIDQPRALGRDFINVRKFRAAAEQQNEPLEFMYTNYSPPAWMKVNRSLGCYVGPQPHCSVDSCRLEEGREPDLADHLVRVTRLIKDSTGEDLYALSLQNEPMFAVAFASCVYCPLGYRTALKALGAQFAQEGLTTRLIGPEHGPDGLNYYGRAIRADTQAMEYLYAWCMHGYVDGNNADTGSFDGSTVTDKPLWSTETSDPGPLYGWTMRDWPRGLQLARTILSALRDGKVSVWLWWSLLSTTTEELATFDNASRFLMVNGQPTDKYYACAHFFRYIRPGARQIASSSDNSAVRTVAFYHEANDCMTIVLVNTGPATTVSVNVAGMPATFEKITSTNEAKLQCSTVASDELIVLPDSSIVSLVAGAYRGTGSNVAVEQQARPGPLHVVSSTSAVRTVLLRLDGRLVGSPKDLHASPVRQLPAGIYVRARIDNSGRVVSATRISVGGL